ncbi:MAG: DUF4347 domain-containing protein [Aquabacterium sp.]
MEPRLLFNADVAAVVPDPAVAAAASNVQATPQVQYLPPQAAAQEQTATPPQNSSSTDTTAATAKPVELVFVDANVKDADKLVASIMAQQDGSTTLEVHYLDAQHDGVAQITQVLEGRHDIAALHIISHGKDGTLELGNTILDANSLAAHAQDLSSWQQALTEHADLMLYGCDVAQTAAGQHFVDDLGLLTGMDVAASTDNTGSASLGGNWVLEFHDGLITTASLMQKAGADDWQGLLAITSAGTETGIPVTAGAETTVTNRQVAADSSGNFVVIWQDGTNIKAQRYTAAGALNGATITVASSGTPANAQVAMNDSGAFVIVWNDSSGNLLFRTYSNAGVAGTTTTVAATSTASVGYPFYSAKDTTTNVNASVAINGAGEFVVVWDAHVNSVPDVPWYTGTNTDTIQWKAFTAAGAAQGTSGSGTVSSNTVGNASPSIGMNSAGAFVISYTDSGGNIYAQRYSAARVSQGSSADITGNTGGSQSSVAMDSNGNYVIAYNSSGVIKFRMYNSSGTATTAVTQANLNPGGTTPANSRAAPSVSMDASGNFVVSWQNTGQDASGGTGVYMRNFNASGVSTTADVLVNTTTSGNQQYSSVVLTGNNAIIVWSGNGTGDSNGVFFQRYTVINNAPTLTATAANPTFTEAAGVGTQAAAVAVYSGAAVSTIESGQRLIAMTFTVSGLVDGANEKIVVDGTAITLGANSSGTTATNGMSYTVSISGGTATVTLTSGSGVSSANMQTLVNGITYQNTNLDQPTSGNRVFTITQLQDSGGTAAGGVDTTTLAVLSTVAVLSRNDPPSLTATGNSPSFTEAGGVGTQASAVTIYSGAAVSTIETGQLITALTFTVSGLVDGANEVIVVDGKTITLGAASSGTTTTNGMSYTVSISGSTATVALTSASGMAASDVQTVVNGITYQNTNTDNPTGGNRVFTLTQIKDNGGTANGGSDTTALSVTSTVTVNPVNDPPTLTTTASNPTFTEAAGAGTQAAAVGIYSGTAISTVESTQTVSGLTFTVSGLVDGANEVIVVDGKTITLGANSSGTTTTNAMTYNVSIASGTATVTLTKAAGISTSNAQALVNGITYQNTNTDNPTAGNRVFTLTQVKDNGGTANGGSDTTALSISSTVTVKSVNDAPTLSATASNPTFTEAAGVGTQAAAVSLYSGTAVSTVESGQTIISLTFTVSGLVDGANEKISVDGTAITLGAASSGTTATNGMSYNVSIASGTATVTLTSVAGITSANTQTLVNGITYQNTNTDNPTGGNRVFTLTQVKDNGGTANGGNDTTALSVASTVTVKAVNDAPTLTTTASNPAFTEAAGVGTQAAAVGLYSGTAISTIEPGQTITGLTFTVSGLVDGANEKISVDGTAITLGAASSGTTATNGMSYNVSITSGTATVTLTSASGISTANAQALVNGITYQNTNTDQPTGGNRVFTLTQIKDSGGTANGGSDTTALSIGSTVTVNSVNDAPTLSATASNPTFTEAAGVGTQAAAVGIYSGAAVSTIESGQTITGLTFTVSGLVDGANEVIVVDGKSIALGAASSGTTTTNGMTYNVSITSGTATIALTKSAGISTANAQTLVNGITYQNTNTDQPTSGNRVFTLTMVKDSGGTSNGGADTTALSIASTVTVKSVNDAPTLSATANNPTFTEPAGLGTQGAAVTVYSGAAVSTIESGQNIKGLTFTVSGLVDGANEVIVVDGKSIALGAASSGTTTTNGLTYTVSITSGTATVTLTGSITAANTQTLINGITYQNTNADNPTGGNRVFKLTQIVDNGGTANGGADTTNVSITSTVGVSPTNDAPVANDDVANTAPGVPIDVDVLANDFDPDTPRSSWTVTIVSVTGGATVTVNPDKTINVDPGANTGTQTIVYRLSDGSLYSDATLTVNLSVNNPPTSGPASQTILEDTPYALQASDFPFTDDAGQSLGGVTITSLPTTGALKLNGVAVSANDVISVADINAGKLVFTPLLNDDADSSFTFKVRDNLGEPAVSSSTFTFHITPVDDAPTLVTNGLDPSFEEAAGLGTQAPAVNVFTGTAIDTVESGQTITGLTFTVGGLQDGAHEVVVVDGQTITLGANSSGMTATNNLAYTVSLAGGTATITLSDATGISTSAAQTLVDGITYQNTNADDPSAGDRVFTLTQITDSGSTANGGSNTTNLSIASTVSVTAVNDAPTLSTTAGNPTFTEAPGLGTQAPPVNVFSGTSINTVESGQALIGLNFTVSGIVDGNHDTLIIDGTTILLGGNSSGTTATNGMSYDVIVSNGTATISLTSGSGISVANAQTLIDGIQYQNTDTDNPTAGNRVVTVTQIQDDGGTLNGGSDSSAPNQSSTITVVAVNDAPTLGNNHGLTLNEGGVATITSTQLSVSDPDNSTSQLIYTITGLPTHGQVELSSNVGVAITSFTQADLDAGTVRYRHDGSETTSDSLTFTVSDGAGGGIGSTVFNISVTPVNDPPTLTATPQNPTFMEAAGQGTQAPPVQVFSGASASAVEAGQLIKGLSFTVSGLHDGVNEVIVVDGSTITLGANSSGTTATNGMSYNVSITSGTATVTLDSASGISAASTQALVNGITYQNTSTDNPTSGSRVFTLTQIQDDGGTANGGSDTGTLAIASSVTVTAVNDAPTLSTTANNPTFMEASGSGTQAAAVAVFSGTSIGYVETGQKVTDLRFTVSGLLDGANETIIVDGSTIALGANSSGTTSGHTMNYSVTISGGTATVSLNKLTGISANTAQGVIDGIGYQNTNTDRLTSGNRVFTLTQIKDSGGTANGGADTTTLSIASTVQAVNVNDAPTLSTTANNPSFIEAPGLGTQAAAVNVFSGTSIDTIESGQKIIDLSFTVGGLLDGANEVLRVDGSTIALGASSSGTTATNGMSYTVTIAGNTATVVLSSGSGITASAAQTLVNGIAYQNTNTDTPTSGNRVFTLTRIQDDGGTANGGTDTTVLSTASTVQVLATNDAPTLSTTAGNPTFTEAPGVNTQAPAVGVFSGTSISTIESGQLITGLSLSITGLRDGVNEVLVIDGTSITFNASSAGTTSTNGLAYTVTVTGGSATISLTSGAGMSSTNAQTLVDGITYQNTNRDNPTSGARAITITQLTDDGGSANGGSNVQTLSVTSTVTVTAVNDAPTGTVTITGTPTQYQTLTASNTLADPDGMGTITYHWLRNGIDTTLTGSTYTLTQGDVNNVITVRATYTDGGGTVESVTSAGTAPVVNVNDAPELPPMTLTAIASPTKVWRSGALMVQARDLDNDVMSIVIVQAPQHGTLTLLANGDVNYTANTGYVGTDNFAYRVTDGQLMSAGSRQVVIQATGNAGIIGAPPSTTPVDPPTTTTTTTTDTKPATDTPTDKGSGSSGSNGSKDTSKDTTGSKSQDGGNGTRGNSSDETAGSGTGSGTGSGSGAGGGAASPLQQRISGGSWLRQASGDQVSYLRQGMFNPGNNTYINVLSETLNGAASIGHLLELIQPAVPHVADINLMSTPLSAITHALPPRPESSSLLDRHSDEPGGAIRLTRAASYSTGLGISIGTIWWTARVSGLLTSALISTPAWRTLDPLPVITSPDDDTDDEHANNLGDKEVEHLFDADRPVEQDLPIIQ